jgi:hypothetical protein
LVWSNVPDSNGWFMAEQQFEYKGHIITTDEDAQPHPLLMIDDIHFHVHKLGVPGVMTVYHSMACCYHEPESLLELGKALHDMGIFRLAGGTHH